MSATILQNFSNFFLFYTSYVEIHSVYKAEDSPHSKPEVIVYNKFL